MKRGSRWVAAAIVVVGVVLVVWRLWERRDPLAAFADIQFIDSVAVLPIENRTGDPGVQYLCDGIADEIVGRLKEVGVNFPWPLEVAAGMDGIALRKKFGKELILGGHIDKRAFIKGKDNLKQEVMSKVPYLCETGGFFPGLDHAIPPDVPFENFKYFINLLREIAGQDRLSD